MHLVCHTAANATGAASVTKYLLYLRIYMHKPLRYISQLDSVRVEVLNDPFAFDKSTLNSCGSRERDAETVTHGNIGLILLQI